jgi:hypothetical protein
MSVQPARHNFTAVKGATFHPVITLYQDADGSQPKPLSSHSAELIVYDQTTDATLLTLNTENGGITLDPTSGEVELFASDEDTAAWNWTQGLYRFKLTDPFGNTDVLLFGAFIVKST